MALRTRLPQVVEEIKKQASEALLQTAKDIYDVSQQLVPVDTGALKQSGGVVPETSERVVIGYGNGPVDYSRYVEYGSSRSPSQPFLTPAFAQAKATFEVRLRQALAKVK